MFLPKIYPITDQNLSGLPHVEQTKRFVNGGAKIVQLRDKTSSPIEFYDAAREAVEFARLNDLILIINDRVDIALTLGADGVHLGQDDLPPENARRLLGSNSIIGLSTHRFDQAQRAITRPVDYIAVGPIFMTTTKTNPETEVGLEGLKQIRQAIGGFPLVAIGGITKANFQNVLDAGADSVAIISGLLRDPKNISNVTNEYISTAFP